MRVLFIDNFDSFTFNLVDEFQKRGCEVDVWRNDVSVRQALEMARDLVVLSPGPGAPAEAGCCIELIRQGVGKVPMFGVCLGHQAMVEALGGVVGSAGCIVHGKASPVVHDGQGVFAGLPSPMPVARYHSLAASSVPDVLKVTARTGDTVMAVEHRTEKLLGVQFHPESILTPQGGRFLDNVLAWATR
ncbi:MAG TPA: aminodeoxychorismate/anthranilate synthase component II [Candidatus Xenobia bacterium]|jgi:anthranilate synthase component 2